MRPVQLCLSCGCPPYHLCCCTPTPLTSLGNRVEEQIEDVNIQVASMINLQLPVSAALGKSPMIVPTFLLPCISLRALERGFMSSCLKMLLKMRSTEHFPNSPQFTFSIFSLGCQAFVVIFINSNCWLFPFLLRKTSPLAATSYQPISRRAMEPDMPCFS